MRQFQTINRAALLSLLISLCPFTAALAGGCAPTPLGASDLPPCCATTDMHNGGRCTAPATQYQFTLAAFGFEKSDGTEVRFGSPQLFDAAAVSAGSAIGDYLSGIDLPAATYSALRPSLGEQITLRVNSLTADGRRCTGSLSAPARQPNGSNWPECGAGEPDSGTTMCKSGGLLKIRDSRIGTFTINNTSNMTLNFQFDVNNGVICNFPAGTGESSSIEQGVLSVTISKS
jgi:hypothetical protein